MPADDMRYYETFYGIHLNDWGETFGNFANHHKILTKNYKSMGVISTDSSSVSLTHKFLYPHHIKKTYFIEGTITGHVTYESSTCSTYLCAYRVTVCKVNEDTSEDELFTTGWRTVQKILGWNHTYETPSSIEGEEGSVVLPFEIDAWKKEELGEFDRIYLKVETTCSLDSSFINCGASTCSETTQLWHSNDASWEDIKVIIPLRLG